MIRPVEWVGEQISDISRWFGGSSAVVGLRSLWRVFGTNGFFGGRPVMDATVVDMDLARALYRNELADCNLGAGFCRPIIDLGVEFIGLPFVSSENEDRDVHLNDCIHQYWAPQLLEAWRNAMRDAKTIVRMVRPSLTNPLVTQTEREHCTLVLIDPERVHIIRNPADHDEIEKAFITHWVEFDESEGPTADPTRGGTPNVKEHQIIEEVTPERYRYFDKTEDKWLTDWERVNNFGFVELLEIWNEYDSTLSGGQSDLESVYPFVKAFHEVMLQALQAHRYHSMPKLKFKLKDVATFISNNYQGVLDDQGKPVAGAKISWKGKEVFFMRDEEDAEFIEAQSVLGDSKTLLEFLIDCISIAAETPEWAFMRVEGGTSQGAMNAQSLPFEKKIWRKRTNFQQYVQQLCKMNLVMNGQLPERVACEWPVIRIDDLVAKGQAISQIIMGFDVAARNEWLADKSIVGILGTLFPQIQSPQQEMDDAKDNAVILQEAEAAAAQLELEKTKAAAPPSATQGQQPSKNGSGSKSRAKKALATTSASRS